MIHVRVKTNSILEKKTRKMMDHTLMRLSNTRWHTGVHYGVRDNDDNKVLKRNYRTIHRFGPCSQLTRQLSCETLRQSSTIANTQTFFVTLCQMYRRKCLRLQL